MTTFPREPHGTPLERPVSDDGRLKRRPVHAPSAVLRRVARDHIAQGGGYSSWRALMQECHFDREERAELRRLVDEFVTEHRELGA